MTNLYHSFFLSARKWLENKQNHWIWIGVNDRNEEGNFVNMLNETVNYTNWASGEQNNALQKYWEDCVMINLGKWYETSCSLLIMYHALCSQRYNIGKFQSVSVLQCHKVTFELLSLKLLFNTDKFM